MRFLGGAPNLVEGVLANRAEQERLAREEPDNAMRIFGEAVEARGSTSLGETLASAMERGIQRGVEKASAAIQAAQERAGAACETGRAGP